MSQLGGAFPFVEIVNLVKIKRDRVRHGLKQWLLKVWIVDDQHQFHLGTY